MSEVSRRPQLTFAVGIAGHKPDKLSGDAARHAEQLLGEVFAKIEEACVERLARDRALYRDPRPRLCLYSVFTEGAARIAVKLCQRSWEVTAVLPFPRPRYEEEFVSRDEAGAIVSDRRAEFAAALPQKVVMVELEEAHEPQPAAQASPYAKAGGLMLRQIDMLVAVWDGMPAAHRGGTADVVAKALESGIPVVWIASNREQPPWIISRLADTERSSPLADATKGPIAEAIEAALAVSPLAAARLEEFFSEPSRLHCAWFVYDALTKLPKFWSWRLRLKTRGLAECSEDWRGFLEEMPEGGDFRKRIEALLLPRFAAADAQATHFAHAYRSAYVLCYLFAVLAIAFALIGVLPIGPGELGGDPLQLFETGSFSYLYSELALLFKAGLVACEFVLILAVILLVHYGKKGRWHERWLDCRALAEMLRHLRFLAPVAESANHQFQREASEHGSEWVLWYLRATIRELGCPNALLDATYQRRILRATEHAEIDGQILWHGDNQRTLKHLHHRLQAIGDVCFGATAVMLLLFLVGFVVWLALRFGVEAVTDAPSPWAATRAAELLDLLHRAKPFLIVFAALLPAIGAAVAGIRFTGDFEGYADRSMLTASELIVLKSRYARAVDSLELDKTAAILIETARLMGEDIDGWQSLYTRKRLALPA